MRGACTTDSCHKLVRVKTVFLRDGDVVMRMMQRVGKMERWASSCMLDWSDIAWKDMLLLLWTLAWG